MKPYGLDYYKHRANLRSSSKKAKLIARNADRSVKKSRRQEFKVLIKNILRCKDY